LIGTVTNAPQRVGPYAKTFIRDCVIITIMGDVSYTVPPGSGRYVVRSFACRVQSCPVYGRVDCKEIILVSVDSEHVKPDQCR